MNTPTGSPSFQKRNPHLFGTPALGWGTELLAESLPKPHKRLRRSLNKSETKYCAILESKGYKVRKQSITLALDPPYKSYTPDLAYKVGFALVLVEVKGPHRFREKGIAKAALAAKTYPEFTFLLADWVGGQWKETILSP